MMPRCALLLFLLLSIGGCKPVPLASEPAQKIRIVSWNLDWFPGKKPEPTAGEAKIHMEAAQRALKELKPDILLLQEMRDWQSAEQLCSVVPGLRVHVISRFQPRPQNQAIATNLP